MVVALPIELIIILLLKRFELRVEIFIILSTQNSAELRPVQNININGINESKWCSLFSYVFTIYTIKYSTVRFLLPFHFDFNSNKSNKRFWTRSQTTYTYDTGWLTWNVFVASYNRINRNCCTCWKQKMWTPSKSCYPTTLAMVDRAGSRVRMAVLGINCVVFS